MRLPPEALFLPLFPPFHAKIQHKPIKKQQKTKIFYQNLLTKPPFPLYNNTVSMGNGEK